VIIERIILAALHTSGARDDRRPKNVGPWGALTSEVVLVWCTGNRRAHIYLSPA
jgi:hypothetical protein